MSTIIGGRHWVSVRSCWRSSWKDRLEMIMKHLKYETKEWIWFCRSWKDHQKCPNRDYSDSGTLGKLTCIQYGEGKARGVDRLWGYAAQFCGDSWQQGKRKEGTISTVIVKWEERRLTENGQGWCASVGSGKSEDLCFGSVEKSGAPVTHTGRRSWVKPTAPLPSVSRLSLKGK